MPVDREYNNGATLTPIGWWPARLSTQRFHYLANTRRAIGGVVGVVAGIALTPVLAPPILGIFGFSAVGPVAGKFRPVPKLGSQ